MPNLSPEILFQPAIEQIAADAIIAFGLMAELRETANSSIELRIRLGEAFGESYPGKNVVEMLCGNNASLSPLDDAVVAALIQLRSDAYLLPLNTWEIGLRLFEKCRQSNFRRILVPALARWMRENWQRIVTNETFRLSRPMQTVPAIEALLGDSRQNEAFVASLLLSSSEAVESPLAVPYEQLLREIVGGHR